MKILYIVSKFPSLTHTFVYREIESLKKAGYEIVTVGAVKPASGEVSPEAYEFYRRTLYLSEISFISKLLSQFAVLIRRPWTWLKLFIMALKEKEIQCARDRLRIIYNFLEAGLLFLKFSKNGIEHIHSHFLSGPTTIAFFLSRYLDCPFSFTMHASLIYVDPIMLKTKLDKCKKAVTISNYNKEYLVNKYGQRYADKIDIIRCGIDLSQFKVEKKMKHDRPSILAVGQLAERKGFPYLVDACKILTDRGHIFTCNIVGDGSEKEKINTMISKNGLKDVVNMLGRQPQEKVRQLLAETSIFVLPAIITPTGGREGIPVAIMEAMAMRVPVISTKTSGIPELIDDGKEGILIDQKDSQMIADAIEKLITNPELSEFMGIAGREKVEAQFNIGLIPEAFKNVFCYQR